MPGIAGIVSSSWCEENKQDLSCMLDSMMHEPFYTSGSYVNDQLCIYVGWVCHVSTISDCMPIYNEEKNLMMIFSGEIFPDEKIIMELASRGHKFHRDDLSYLIHSFEEEGDKFFRNLNGWFSGIIVDLRRKKIVLFNDRYGMQRTYYFESENEFLFSSEAKSLLKVRPELRQINFEGLGEFFLCGCPLNNKSLYSKIYTVPGGSAWIFAHGNKAQKENYFAPEEWENQAVLKKEEFYENFKATFTKILPRYFRAGERIGLSLTGGLDTRMILACRENRAGSLPCYTFGGSSKETNDIKIARKVAGDLGQNLEVLKIQGDFFRDFPGYAEKTILLTDGLHDVCGSHEIYLNRLAREIALIRMTGNFGGEVLRGVSILKEQPVWDGVLAEGARKLLLGAKERFLEEKEENSVTFAAFKEIPWRLYGSLAAGRSQLIVRSPFMDNDLVALIYQAPEECRKTNELSIRLIREGNPSLAKIMTDRGMRIDGSHPVGKIAGFWENLLFKAEYRMNEGMPDWLVKGQKVIKWVGLPIPLLGRHRYLFYKNWFQEELSQYIKEILLDPQSLQRPYLQSKAVVRMVEDHIKGKGNYLNEINRLLSLELIHRILL